MDHRTSVNFRKTALPLTVLFKYTLHNSVPKTFHFVLLPLLKFERLPQETLLYKQTLEAVE